MMTHLKMYKSTYTADIILLYTILNLPLLRLIFES